MSSTSSYNNWAGATLKTELNGTYLNSLTSEAQSMIENAKYYLGGYNTSNIQKDAMYQYERKIQNITSNEFYYGKNPNSWIGKIALMYVSDYGYATSDECTKSLNEYNNITCKTNNWLFNSVNQWLLSHNTSNFGTVFIFGSDGNVYNNNGSRTFFNSLAVRPVLYLKSSVKITGGSGTSTNPYTLGL